MRLATAHVHRAAVRRASCRCARSCAVDIANEEMQSRRNRSARCTLQSVNSQSNRFHQRTPTRDIGVDQPPERFRIRFKIGLEAGFYQHALEALLREDAARSLIDLLDDGA